MTLRKVISDGYKEPLALNLVRYLFVTKLRIETMNLGIFITLISSILALSRQHYFNRHHRKQISHTANALARAIPPCRVYSGKTPRACHLNEKRKHIMHYLRKLQAWNVSKTVHIPINSVKIIETEKCLSIEADLSTNKNIPKNCPFFVSKKPTMGNLQIRWNSR